MMSLFFVNKFLKALVTEQEVSAGAQLPWLPDAVSKDESFLSSFEQHEEALLDWVRSLDDVSAKYTSMQVVTIRWLSDCLKRRIVLSLSYAGVACLVAL